MEPPRNDQDEPLTSDPVSPSSYGHSVRDSLDEWFMGMSSQYGEREDMLLTEDLRNFVFGPINYNRRDLAALNIQRGRDNGVPDYNTVREAYGLPRVTNYSQITPNTDIQHRLATVYSNRTDFIDLWVGGMAETNSVTGNPGPLFQRILLEQFGRTRDADRFWYANQANGYFTPAEIQALDGLKFSEIIRRNTNIPAASAGGVQDDGFRFREDLGDPCAPPANLGEESLENCTPLATHDFWTDAASESLPGTAMLFVSFFILTVFALLLTVWWQRKQRTKLLQEIEASLSKPTHEFDDTVTPPEGNFAAAIQQQQDHQEAAPLLQASALVTLSQPAPKMGVVASNGSAGSEVNASSAVPASAAVSFKQNPAAAAASPSLLDPSISYLASPTRYCVSRKPPCALAQVVKLGAHVSRILCLFALCVCFLFLAVGSSSPIFAAALRSFWSFNQSACVRIGGRQLDSSNCLLVRQAVWSRALLRLDEAATVKTTRVRQSVNDLGTSRATGTSGSQGTHTRRQH